MKASIIATIMASTVLSAKAADSTMSLPINPDDVANQAILVNDYFMTKVCPDPTADSHVGGKVRNSRIWTRGVYYEGLMAMYRQLPVDSWLDYTEQWGNYHQWISNDTSAPANADYHCCGMAYLDMYNLDPTKTERKEHIKSHIDYLMNERKSINDWWWVDAVHMAMPIYAQLGVIENDPSYFEYMYDMYMYTRDKQGDTGSKKSGKGKGAPLFNEKDGLWYRDYKFDPPYTDKVEKDKPCYWSRGCGWAYTALVRVMDYGPSDLPHRDRYEADFKLMSDALLRCQRPDGFWNVSLAAPTNFGSTAASGPETSGTALFVAGMAWGINNGLLDKDTYLPCVMKGWNALSTQAVGTDGFLKYVQGTGSSPEDSQPVTDTSVPNFEDFGVGCFLLATSEVYKLAKSLDNSQSGVNDMTITEKTIADVMYFNIAGEQITSPVENGVTIVRYVYSDGSTTTKKFVK